MKNNGYNLKFGTDGWRAVISDDFTFENVKKIAKAMALYSTQKEKTPKIVVGYDTRFLSKESAKLVADVFSNSGCETILGNQFVSTPCLSLNVLERKAFGGIMITASHNPYQFNGIKFKTSEGCSAPEQVTQEIENNLFMDFEKVSNGSLNEADLIKPYLKKLVSNVDLDVIKKSKLKIVFDPMYGSGIDYVGKVLKNSNCKCIQIHGKADPLFGGLNPEPIGEHLFNLKKEVLKNRASCGVATDGDGDRIGVIDEKGRCLTPHQVFPLLLYYLCKYRGMKGKVVQTISLGYVSERIAKNFNLQFEEVPVGFKYIAEKIINENILMGGEESGGYGYGNYIPERDGILNSLKIIEMLSFTGKKLSELISEIEKKYGKSSFIRTDFINPGIEKAEFVKKAKEKAPDNLDNLKVKTIKDYDGIEFVLEDDSWLLMRPSGTEPVIRVYAESEEIKKTKRLIKWGSEIVGSLI